MIWHRSVVGGLGQDGIPGVRGSAVETRQGGRGSQTLKPASGTKGKKEKERQGLGVAKRQA